MEGYSFEDLASPESRSSYATAMAALSLNAGAERFLVIRLHGSDLQEVIHVVHNGTGQAHERFGGQRHWSVERMLDVMRASVVPQSFGGGDPGIDVDGYRYGVSALAIDEKGGCIVYLGLPEEADEEQKWKLAMAAQLCATYSLKGLAARAPRPCPLREKEMACLKLFAAGYSVKAVARTLGISGSTVEAHLDRVRVRCGVDTSLAAAVMAIKEGWLDLHDVQSLKHTG